MARTRRHVPGLTPEVYHLAGNEKLNEAASRSGNRRPGRRAGRVPEPERPQAPQDRRARLKPGQEA